jgi:hypothetical protein
VVAAALAWESPEGVETLLAMVAPGSTPLARTSRLVA